MATNRVWTIEIVFTEDDTTTQANARFTGAARGPVGARTEAGSIRTCLPSGRN